MLESLKQRVLSNILCNANPQQLISSSEFKAIHAFKNAALRIPAYKEFLKKHNVSINKVNSIEAFKQSVPIINKEKTFRLYSSEIEKLCLPGHLVDTKTIISSSGHSGCFSFGLSSEQEIKQARKEIDRTLNFIFQIKKKKTLLINALPMGVKVYSALTTVVDTSVRSDIVCAAVKTFAHYYDQIIIVAENSFAKKILEDGLKQGIDWKNINIHLVLGEEILPENLRNYLATIIGVNPDEENPKGIIGSSFGISEIGLNVFYETTQTTRLRRLIKKDKSLRAALIGEDSESLPMIFQYNPLKIYVEEVKTSAYPHLVLTRLDKKTILPLIRYDTQDEGKIIHYNKLKETLESRNYQEYLPHLKLPLVIIWGREKITTCDGKNIRPEIIKELLYDNIEVAKNISGYFRMALDKNQLKIEIQLKEGKTISRETEKQIKEKLSKNIPTTLEIVIYPYREFPYGLGLSYERKFEYM